MGASRLLAPHTLRVPHGVPSSPHRWVRTAGRVLTGISLSPHIGSALKTDQGQLRTALAPFSPLFPVGTTMGRTSSHHHSSLPKKLSSGGTKLCSRLL